MVRITKNLEGAPMDMAYRISDQEALPVLFDLIEQEGLVLGGSSAINIVGAIRLARDLGPGLITMPRGQKSSSAVGTRNCLPESNLIVSALASGTRRVLGKVGRRKSAQVIGAQAGQNGPGAEHVSFGALRVADFKRGTPPNVHGRSPVGAERARL